MDEFLHFTFPLLQDRHALRLEAVVSDGITVLDQQSICLCDFDSGVNVGALLELAEDILTRRKGAKRGAVRTFFSWRKRQLHDCAVDVNFVRVASGKQRFIPYQDVTRVLIRYVVAKTNFPDTKAR